MVERDYYHFTLGDFKGTCLWDATVRYDLKDMYMNVPVEQVEAALRERGFPTEAVFTPYTYPVVDTGKQRVLVDTGAGKLNPATGHIRESMAKAGIRPEDIEMVILSHAHPDHIGGMLDEEGKPVYRNAHFLIWKDEWDFWFSDAAEQKTPRFFVDVARKNLEPVRGKISLLDCEGEIERGVSVMQAPGHTPGHAVISFQSGGEKLMYIADTVLQPLHLEEPDWLPVFDILPDKAAESKKKIFDLVSDERMMVLGQHFPPFPSLGHVKKQEKGWKWEPIEV